MSYEGPSAPRPPRSRKQSFARCPVSPATRDRPCSVEMPIVRRELVSGDVSDVASIAHSQSSPKEQSLSCTRLASQRTHDRRSPPSRAFTGRPAVPRAFVSACDLRLPLIYLEVYSRTRGIRWLTGAELQPLWRPLPSVARWSPRPSPSLSPSDSLAAVVVRRLRRMPLPSPGAARSRPRRFRLPARIHSCRRSGATIPA